MKLFRVLVLVIALVAGGVAAFLALNVGNKTPAAVAEAPMPTGEQVLVAAKTIKQGDKLSAENVRWQLWPSESLDPAVVKQSATPDAVDKLKDAIARFDFIAGEPIIDSKLARSGSGLMAAILPAGKRAIAVRVSANNTAGGFILPNDRVDVLQTTGQQGGADAAAINVSRTILGNIKVLAIDQTVQQQNGEQVVVGKTATLELDPGQVETVTAAEASGTLALALRSYADMDEAATAERQQKTGTIRIFRSGRSQIVTSKQ